MGQDFLEKIRKSIFSITGDGFRKVVKILGIKIKFKQKINPEVLRCYFNKFVDIRLAPKATGNLRKIQLLELYMMKELKKICDDIGVKFWMKAGTALGAYRHQGFIPWDDDIDLGIMREDFDKLVDYVNNNSQQFEIVYFYTKTFKLAKFVFKNVEGGIFVDLFPFDWCSYKNSDEFWLQWKRDKKQLSNVIKKLNFSNNSYAKDINTDVIKQIETENDKFKAKYANSDDKSGVCSAIEQFDSKSKKVFPAEMIFPLKLTKFEDGEFYTVNDEDGYLSQCYGEYMQFPKDLNLKGHDHMFSEKQKSEIDRLYSKYL